MPACARCKDFTDNSAEGEYRYCSDCMDAFRSVRQTGVVVRGWDGDYSISVHDENFSDLGGAEMSQVEALARGKLICDDANIDGLFEYTKTGSTWILDEYLDEHPGIAADVNNRLAEVPDKGRLGLVEKFRRVFL